MTQRGNDRRAIFLDDQDRLGYLAILGRWFDEGRERLHAYCLMSNHVHLLVQAHERRLSEPMQVLGSRYARRFNDRWSHKGHLFQGRFHSTLIGDDAQLAATVRYIHQNPTRACLAEDPACYRWSSHRAYLGLEAGPSWLCVGFVLGTLHPDRATARRSFADLLNGPTSYPLPENSQGSDPDVVSQVYPRASLSRILSAVAVHTGCSLEEICGAGNDRRASGARYAVVVLARAIARTPMHELGQVLGRDVATLCNGVARRSARPDHSWEDLIEGVKHFLSSEMEMEVPDPF